MKNKNNKRSPIVSLVTVFALMFSLCSGILIMDGAQAQSQNNKINAASVETKNRALARYTQDLTKLARRGAFDLTKGNEAAIRPIIQILSRSKQNNPVLIGEDNAESKAVIEGLARRIATGDVPENLRQTRLYSLNLYALFEGVKTPADLEGRLKAMLSEASSTGGDSIFFIDELQQFVGKRAAQTVSQAMAEAAVGGKVRLIGATSSSAYEEYIASDATLDGLFQQINLEDSVNSSDASETSDSEDSNKNSNGFQGEKISPDLRQLMQGSGTERVGVILQVDDVKSGQLNDLFKRYGVEVNARMAQLGTLKVEMPVKALEELAARKEIHYVSVNREVRSFGHVSATTGADSVRQQTTTSLLGGRTNYTLDGSGVGIAILDSGIDTNHKSFVGVNNSLRVVFSKDFTGENRTDDPYGHGTHVASTAAGNGRISNGQYIGIAPNANIINLRVLNGTGAGSVSGLLSALDWVMTNRTTYNIRVVNMSLGMPAFDSYKNDPVCRAVRRLVDAGVVVVAAAGNNGKNSAGQKMYGQTHSPGIEPSAITVGAANTLGTNGRADDVMATYSSRGPTRGSWTDANGVKHYDNLIKPDVVAPGNKLVFAEAENNLLVTQHPELDAGVGGNETRREMYLNGTSMATPVAAGSAALLLQANPKLTPNMIKMLLMYTAQQLPGFNMFEQGAGEINIEGAVRMAKLVRTDLLSSTLLGAPLLTTATLPTPQTTIAGQTFTWAQGIVLNHYYATGTNLVAQYQKVYAEGVLLGDGDVVPPGDGVLLGDGVLFGDGVLLGDEIKTSDGVLLGDGTLFCSNSVLLDDGVLLADGVLLGDGVLPGDGVLLGDAYLQALSAAFSGDDTPSMELEVDCGVDYLGY